MDFPVLSRELRSSLETATATYEAAMPASPAISYLQDKRGIDPDVVAGSRLGFVAEPEPGHEQMVGRLAIPYITPCGVVDLRFRAIDDQDEPKYLSQPGSHPRLYNVGDLHLESDVIAVVEGEMNTVVLSTLCGVPAVGLAGTNAWQSIFKLVFEDYRRVFIVMNWTRANGEPDTPGRKAANKLKKELENGLIVAIDEPGDLNELFMEYGPEWVQARVVKSA